MEDGLRIYTNDDNEVYQVNVFDATGRSLISVDYRSGQLLNLSPLSTSWAAVQVVDQKGRTTSSSIIIR